MGTSKWGVRGVLSAAVVLIAGAQAVAGPLFDTFKAGNEYTTWMGWKIGFPDEGWDQGDWFSFSGTQSYALESIELAMALKEGANAVDVWLMTDSGGQPGTILESFSFVGAMGPFDGALVPPLVGYSTSHPILNPDTYYWLIASAPDDAATSVAWCFSSAGFVGPHAQRTMEGSWSIINDVYGAFRINGTAPTVHTPVPGAVLLGTIGMGVAGGILRRRRML